METYTLQMNALDKDRKIEIFYDGTCNLCSGMVERIDKSSKKESFEARAVSEEQLPHGIDHEAAMRDVHVVDETGRIYAGAEAVLRILDEYPRLQTLARIGRFPGIKHLLAILYRVVAMTRYRIFGRK